MTSDEQCLALVHAIDRMSEENAASAELDRESFSVVLVRLTEELTNIRKEIAQIKTIGGTLCNIQARTLHGQPSG